MATVILRGWKEGSTKPLIPLVKALRTSFGCSLPEAVEIAEQCTDLGQTVIREEIPSDTARQLAEDLRALAFDIQVEE